MFTEREKIRTQSHFHFYFSLDFIFLLFPKILYEVWMKMKKKNKYLNDLRMLNMSI